MRVLLTLFILFLVLLLVARKPRPAEDQQGVDLLGTSEWTEPSQILKVASFNIQTGKSVDGDRDINRSARAVADVDIVGVQEVYASGWLHRLGIGTPQATALAKPGNFHYLFAATRRRWFREHRGNAFLSKLPIKSWETRMLPDQSGSSYRNMVIIKLIWQGEEIVVINTHLHTGKGKEQQLEEVLQEFTLHPRGILMGDFNSTSDTAQLIKLLDVSDQNIPTLDAISVAGIALEQKERIDWILTRGFEVAAGRTFEKGISDHPYYEVSLKLDDRTVE